MFSLPSSSPPPPQSPGSRASRVFPVRHSTVVVHGGEQQVIRKLVVVGVVSAEKTYIDCLSVLKEVGGVMTWYLFVCNMCESCMAAVT